MSWAVATAVIVLTLALVGGAAVLAMTVVRLSGQLIDSAAATADVKQGKPARSRGAPAKTESPGGPIRVPSPSEVRAKGAELKRAAAQREPARM